MEILSSISISSTIFLVAMYLGFAIYHSAIIAFASASIISIALLAYDSRSGASNEIKQYFVLLPLLNLAITLMILRIVLVVLS